MVNADAARLAPVPHAVTNPRRIPAQRYYDEEFFRLEAEHLWPRVWQMACRLEEIPGIGDWTEYTILGRSVIIVRTTKGVRAYHNACRHRGVKLASGHGNCAARGFVCPFHGWRWNMDGENTFVFAEHMFDPEDLDPQDIALAPCRIDFWGGCAFINFDDEAPALRDCLGEAADRMDARNVDRLKVEWWRSAILPTNWKLAMEAFMEGYHVPATHPQLHAVSTPESRMYGRDGPDMPEVRSSASARDYVDVTIQHLHKLSEGMAGMVHHTELEVADSIRDRDWPENIGEAAMAFYTTMREEITRRGQEQGLPMPDLVQAAKDHPFKAVEFMFPHYFMLPMFSAMASYRIRPLTPETCLFEIWSLAMLPDDEDREPPVPPVPMAHDDPSFPEIPRQDYSNLPLQQLGLHAGGFAFMRLQKQTEGMISNYQRLIDGYLAGRSREELARGACVVASGFDAPILDIGF